MSSTAFAAGAETASATDSAKSSDCLAGPKGAAPQGQRWFYRIDRSTKKHCWYTRADSARNVATRTVAPKVETADAEDDALMDAPLQPAVANARAESSRPPDAVAPSSVFPAPSAMISPAAGQTPVTSLPSAATRMLDERQVDQSVAAQPVASQPSVRSKPAQADGYSLWMLFIVIGGVLAVVGIAIAMIPMLARRRQHERTEGHWPSPRWDADDTEPAPPLVYADDEPLLAGHDAHVKSTRPIDWVRTAREDADKHGDRIERVLARPARPAI